MEDEGLRAKNSAGWGRGGEGIRRNESSLVVLGSADAADWDCPLTRAVTLNRHGSPARFRTSMLVSGGRGGITCKSSLSTSVCCPNVYNGQIVSLPSDRLAGWSETMIRFVRGIDGGAVEAGHESRRIHLPEVTTCDGGLGSTAEEIPLHSGHKVVVITHA